MEAIKFFVETGGSSLYFNYTSGSYEKDRLRRGAKG